jgi:hypothetical protein
VLSLLNASICVDVDARNIDGIYNVFYHVKSITIGAPD